MRISIDYDGVLCPTPFGRFARRRPGHVAELPADYAAHYGEPLPSRPLRLRVEGARFAWRPMSRDAADLLRALSREHEQVVIVTGRSEAGRPLIARWLRREGLADAVGLRMAPTGLRPAQHKLAVAKLLGIDAHVDDDPRTAYYLAGHGVPRVYLLDADGAHDAGGAPRNLTVVRSLREFVRAVGHTSSPPDN